MAAPQPPAPPAPQAGADRRPHRVCRRHQSARRPRQRRPGRRAALRLRRARMRPGGGRYSAHHAPAVAERGLWPTGGARPAGAHPLVEQEPGTTRRHPPGRRAIRPAVGARQRPPPAVHRAKLSAANPPRPARNPDRQCLLFARPAPAPRAMRRRPARGEGQAAAARPGGPRHPALRHPHAVPGFSQ